jgi:hypothetical protein
MALQLFTLALDGDQWSASCSTLSNPPGESPIVIGEETVWATQQAAVTAVESRYVLSLPGMEPLLSSP